MTTNVIQEDEGQETAQFAVEETILDTEALVKDLEAAKARADESQEKMLRLAAEFENAKKRLIREQELTLKFAEENILRELLPFIDNLERAVALGRKSADAAALLEGVEMVLKGLLASLDKFGLKAIQGVGEPFDPNFHEALAMEPSKEVPENRILVEFEKGYLYKDRLLRAAKVVVSKGDVQA